MRAGKNCPSVIELMRDRARGTCEPARRQDPWHLALVIEGGGMRGVIAGGMVTGLENLGLLRVFDSVHGSSAGAAAGAYFLAEQAELGTRMFYEDLNKTRFINPLRLFTGRPVMNISYLVDEVFKLIKPLAAERIMTSKIALHVVMTDIRTRSAFVKSSYATAFDLFECLRATTSMPVLAGAPVQYQNRLLFDGGLLQQLALDSAQAAGATHLLVLMTRREGELERIAGGPRSLFEEALVRAHCDANVLLLFRARPAAINEMVSLCYDTVQQEAKGLAIQAVAIPPDSVVIDRMTKDASVLQRGDRAGQQAILDLRIV
jgi:predicted patatin/cPLA2 family phospholipase